MSKTDISPPESEETGDFVDEISWVDTDAGTDDINTTQKIKQLKEELKQVKQERDDYLAQLQRERADAINLRRSEEEKRKQLRSTIQVDILTDLLPVLDSFDYAMQGDAWQNVDKNWRIGVEYIYQQLVKYCNDNGLESSNPIGKQVNYDSDEVQSEEESEKPEGEIIKVVQKGYVHNKITSIRPAKVIISQFIKQA